jgi:hypothetical protein
MECPRRLDKRGLGRATGGHARRGEASPEQLGEKHVSRLGEEVVVSGVTTHLRRCLDVM